MTTTGDRIMRRPLVLLLAMLLAVIAGTALVRPHAGGADRATSASAAAPANSAAAAAPAADVPAPAAADAEHIATQVVDHERALSTQAVVAAGASRAPPAAILA